MSPVCSSRARLLALSTALMALMAFPAFAAATPKYDLRGHWIGGSLAANGTRQPADQTIEFTSMDMRTGRFSGTAIVQGIHFALKGTETGANVVQTLTEGSYVSTDRYTLSIQSDGHLGDTGTFKDSNGSTGGFWAEIVKPASGNSITGGGSGSPGSSPSSPPGSFVSVSCTINAPAPSMSRCTATVGDAGPPPRTSPTGTVKFSTTVGTFVAGDTCTLQATTGSPGVSSCTVAYALPPGTPPGALPVTAAYSGSPTLGSSTGGTGPAAGVLGTSSAPVSSSGTAAVPVANPNPAGLTGTLTLAGASFANGAAAGAASASVGHAKVTLGAYASTVVKLRLSKAARRYLKHHSSLRVTAALSARVSGRTVVKRARLTLRGKR